MTTRETTAPAAAMPAGLADSPLLDGLAGLGSLARRSGGVAAVVLAGLAVHAHRRTGATRVTVGHRFGANILPVAVPLRPLESFDVIAKRVGAELRRGRDETRAGGTPDEPPALIAAQHDSGWRAEVPRAEQPAFLRLFTALLLTPATPIAHLDIVTPDELRRLREINDTAHDIGDGAEPAVMTAITAQARGDFDAAAQDDPADVASGVAAAQRDAAAVAPSVSAAAIKGVSAAERQSLSTATALDGFEAAVRRQPGDVALVLGDRTLTYAELHARAERTARWLRGQGVEPEAVVGLALDRSIEAIVATYAVLLAGGAYVPLDTAQPPERLERILRVARPHCVLSDGRTDFAAAGVPVHRIGDLDLDASDDTPLTPGARPDNLAYLMFTSGSTGAPKGVAVTHAALTAHLAWMTHHLGLDRTDAVLQKTPVTFDVSIWELFWPLHIGARLVIAPPGAQQDPAELARQITAHRVTTVQFVPSTLTAHLNATAEVPAGLRRVLLIGETLTPQLAQRFTAASPAELHNLYGPTEATGAVSGYPVPAGPIAHVPIGGPGWNTRAHVLDAALRPVPDGTDGELYLAGVQLARCYRDDPARTAAHFVADPFGAGGRLYRTGDIVRWNLATGELDYVGRRDFQIKRHGVRIELGEIEAALAACAPVAQAVAVQRAEGRVIGYVVPVPGRVCAESALRRELSDRLPAAMLPDDFVVLDALPMNPAGKVDRAALPAPTAQVSTRAPRTPAEVELAAAFAEVLGRDGVGADESFFALGGDSVMSILLVSRARARGLLFTAQQVFEFPTVAGLAAVATGETADVPAELPGGGVGEVPLTPAIAALIAHAGSAGRDAQAGFRRYAQTMVLELPAGLAAATLHAVLGAVLDRHEMLRARLYRDASGTWRLFADPVTAVDLGAILRRVEMPIDTSDSERVEILAREFDAAADRLDPANGLVLQAVWLEPADGGLGRLLVVVHHIAVDGVSWRILVPDFISAWTRIGAGAPATLPAGGTSMRRWAHILHEQAVTADRAAELEHWRDLLTVPQLPLAGRPLDAAIDTAATVRRIQVDLDETATTAVVSTIPDLYRTTANVALLTALAVAVTRWRHTRADTGSTLLVHLEAHGRDAEVAPGVDLSRTVGWFTAAFPCRFDLTGIDLDDALAGGPALGAAVRAVKEQLRSIPGTGLGHGLLRHLNPATAGELSAEPAQLAFTYLGAIATIGSGPWLPTGEFTAPAALPPATALSVDALVADHRLRAGFSFPETLLRAAEIHALTGLWSNALAALARHSVLPGAGGHTPSDFPLVTLTQHDIDTRTARFPGPIDIWPLTPIQDKFARYALHEVDTVDPHTMQLLLTGTGAPDLTRLRAAAQHLVDRHATLRTAFVDTAAGHPVQIVTAAAAVPWREIDLRARPGEIDALLLDEQLRPFDLETPPLLRFLFLRVDDTHWRLSVTNHRLLFDGWSFPVLMRELLVAYAAGPEAAPDDAGIFRAFLRWRSEQDDRATARAWRAELSEPSAPTLLTAPGAEPPDPAVPQAEHRSTLAGATARGLSRLATEVGVTLNTIVQTAWGLVLGELTGETDVLFGTVVSGRPAHLPGIESAVGQFINTVPVRVRWDPARPIGVLLTEQQAAQARLLDHQYAGLAEIEDAAGVPVRAAFDTLLLFESYPVDVESLYAAAAFDDVALTRLESREATLFPLMVTFWPNDGLHLAVNWHRSLVPADVVARAVEHLHTVLDLLAAPGSAETTVSALNTKGRNV
ncbi:amino acid adenylation domain-containing protein [Nocardia sp. NPDC057668]|uniref:amino acid adenylation domain-containing protein n=1 Tax=Nocardia sp. NPDC057668 TaxID=3346202 RepID=UPI00366AE916